MRTRSVEDYMRMAEDMCTELKINLSSAKLRTMALYVDLLIDGLSKARLFGESTVEELFSKQILDSLYLLKMVDIGRNLKILDLGSGAGFPGIPLHIARPENEMVLLDSNKKKTTFLRNTVNELSLNSVHIVNGRAEDFGHDEEHRGSYDLVVSKAVAGMNVLAELALPFLKIGGVAALYKGPSGDQELREAATAFETCGGEYQKKHDYSLPGGEKRSIYIMMKVKETPHKYPRRTGVPGKKPL